MGTKTITQLSAAAAVLATNEIPINNAGTDEKITALQIKTYVEKNISAWATSTAYTAGQIVIKGNTIYMCLGGHTSGTFSTDWLSSSYWVATGTAPGQTVMTGSATAPPGWVLCDGASLVRANYADLFAVIGTTYGAADGTHFNVPDFRGIFPKGAGTTTRVAGVDANGNAYAATLGAYAQDKMQGHKHDVDISANATANVTAGSSLKSALTTPATTSAVPKTDGTNGTPRVGMTTEPQSVGISFIIKY